MTDARGDRGRATRTGALDLVRVASTAVVGSGGFVELFSQAVGYLLDVTGAGDEGLEDMGLFCVLEESVVLSILTHKHSDRHYGS